MHTINSGIFYWYSIGSNRNIQSLITLLLFLTFSVVAHARAIIFVPLAMETPQKDIRQVKPLVEYLEQQTKEEIKIVNFPDYQELTQQFAATGVKTTIAKKYQHLGIQIITNSQPLPGFVLVANANTLSKKQLNTLQQALNKLSPDEPQYNKKITVNWGEKYLYGMSPATFEDYKYLQKKLWQLNIPDKGNR